MKVDFKFLVKAGVCVNEMGHLKNPVDYFANLAFDYTEELAEPIVKHGNTNNLNSLLEQIPDKDLKLFSDYLSLILPIKFYTPTRSVKPKWLVHDWVGVRISYKAYKKLIQVDHDIDLNKICALRKVIVRTYSGDWNENLLKLLKWPSTDAPPGFESLFPEGWQTTGLLKIYGYRVGKEGLSETQRRAILCRMVEKDIPQGGFTHSYINSWGESNSIERLLKLARTIAALCRNAKRSPNDYDMAIDHWESDLDFLKKKYLYQMATLKDEKWPVV